MSYYRSKWGLQPNAIHVRQSKCGVHEHWVCGADGCHGHIDNWNPDCPGEFVPHGTDDLAPHLVRQAKPIIGPLAIGAVIGLGLLALFSS